VNPHRRTSPELWGTTDAQTVVIGVHGRGQGVRDVRAISDRLDIPHARWVAPRAAGNTWYPYHFMDRRPDSDPWLEWALDAIEDAVNVCVDEGTPIERIALLGFSQGACLLAHHALTRPRRYAGIVLYTGGYIGAPNRPARFDGAFQQCPVLLATIDGDPWVPAERVRETEKEFRRLGATVTALFEAGEIHGITENAITLGRQTLQAAR
jgi:phospholipase/carboxylesterase